MKFHAIVALFGLVVLTTACATTGGRSSTPSDMEATDPAVKAAQEKEMMADCEAMKQQKQKMAEDMKSQATALTEHVARMNGSSTDKKMGMIADVVTQMAEQQIAMDARKAKMEEEMMKHMMKHMQLGKDSMAKCPMMKMAEGPTAHADHHAEGL